MVEEKNGKALDDLKKLVFRGYITETVEIDGVKFTLKTLNLQEEQAVLEESGLSDNPQTAKDILKYIPVVLSYAITAINDTPVTKSQIQNLLKQANAPSVIAKLYEAHLKLESRRAEASGELKNSSTAPNQSFIG